VFHIDGAQDGSTVALIGSGTALATSSNGTSFTSRTSGLALSTPEFIRHLGGRFVGGGGTSFLTVSATGTSFAAVSPGLPTGAARELAFGNGLYIIAGSDAGAIRKSADLATFGNISSKPSSFNSGVYGAGFINGEFILSSNHAQTVFIASADGDVFEELETNLPFPQARLLAVRH
jgi:hypothetical protein